MDDGTLVTTPKGLQGSQCLDHETGLTVSVFASYRRPGSMIKAFIIGTGHAIR